MGLSISWACGRQFTKSALNNPSKFYAPYFLVWLNTSLMITCYPFYLLYNKMANKISLADSYAEAKSIFGKNRLNFRYTF